MVAPLVVRHILRSNMVKAVSLRRVDLFLLPEQTPDAEDMTRGCHNKHPRHRDTQARAALDTGPTDWALCPSINKDIRTFRKAAIMAVVVDHLWVLALGRVLWADVEAQTE